MVVNIMSTPWRPSRPVAYLLAVLSVWPIAYFFLLLAFIGYMFAATPQQGFEAFRYLFIVHLATIVLMIALMAAYLVHAFLNDRLTPDRRILWVVVLLFFSIFAFPVYWWLYMRPGAVEAQSG